MTAQDIAATIDEDDAGPRPQARRALGVALIVALLAVVLDQGSKALAVAQLTPGERVPLVGDLFGLSLVYNPGAAFSLGSGATWIITLLGVLAAVAVVIFAVRLSGARWGLVLGLVLGGAVGNLIDRLLNPPAFGRGQVTDFLAYGDLFVGNVADVVVVLGVGLVCLNLFKIYPSHDSGQRTNGQPFMKVELLHIVDCPNTAIAEAHARAALDTLGFTDVPVELVTIQTEAEAASSAFGGSPTILVDGVDLFPTAPVQSLACRVYATGSGFAGAPTQEQLEVALRDAGDLASRAPVHVSIIA